jgi:hypothetical protein
MLNMDANTPKLQITPAQSLEEVYRTLQPGPLETPEEMEAFYKSEMNEVRGGDKMERLKLGLTRAHKNRTYFKACFMGHQGVGKSTELSRLIDKVQDKFRTIRFSAVSTLNPGNFRPLDVVLMMMADVAERTAKPVKEGGAGKHPPEARLKEINEVVEHEVRRLTSLIKVANRLLDDCNNLLQEASGHEWLFVGEDFDRAGIPIPQIEDLFITYANIFRDLRIHLIFNIPVSLFYSSKAPQLPFANECSFVLPDTPVFQPDHTPDAKGRAALQTVLEARMATTLFEPDQMMRLIKDKAERLLQIYENDKSAEITDALLYTLLNARAVQEFNGQHWFGVHPLVVDILAAQKRLQRTETGELLGGTT